MSGRGRGRPPGRRRGRGRGLINVATTSAPATTSTSPLSRSTSPLSSSSSTFSSSLTPSTPSTASTPGTPASPLTPGTPATQSPVKEVPKWHVPVYTGGASAIPSQKGHEKRTFEGYYYVVDKPHKTIPGKVYWRCERWAQACPGRLIEEPGGACTIGRNSHSHEANFGREEALKWIYEVKEKAKKKESTRNLLSGYATLSQEALPNAPSEINLRKRLTYAKSKSKDPYPLPTSINFEIPDPFKWTISANKEEFALIDSGKDDPHRILGFTTNNFLRALMKSETCYGDGTFSVVPSESFYQLYSIHGELSSDCSAPLVFLLLKNKDAKTYTRALSLIKEQVNGLDWECNHFVMDFEKAFIKAVKDVLPDCDITLCFFHLGQSIMRNVSQHGLKVQYQEDSEKRILVNMLKALAFTPQEDVTHLFDELSTEEWGEFESIRGYFEQVYIGTWKMVRIARDHPKLVRQTPDYPPETWNQFQRTLQGQSRTNNRVEAWNSAFSKAIGRPHPTMWQLFRQFQVEANITQSKMEHIQLGTFKRKESKVFVRTDKSLRSLCQKYEEMDDKIAYLRKIANVLGSK